jgi:hypothetical protein
VTCLHSKGQASAQARTLDSLYIIEINNPEKVYTHVIWEKMTPSRHSRSMVCFEIEGFTASWAGARPALPGGLSLGIQCLNREEPSIEAECDLV